MRRNSLKDFCVFILTHGRPDKIVTYNSLIKAGYTGKIFIVIDNEDVTAHRYKELYNDKVIVFDKKKIADRIDEGDNFNDRRAIIYARNACFDLAKELGYTYFIQLDDDYNNFVYKFDAEYNYTHVKIKSLDSIFSILLKYYKSINCVSLAIAQNGDYIGGASGTNPFVISLKPKRKCMNTFICSTERPFEFFGKINEDVNTYTNLGRRGVLFLTINNIAINQITTQKSSGGMTDIYLDSGTFVKSFYSVMYSPSCVKIGRIGNTHQRLHHKVLWGNAVPVILDEVYKNN